MKDNLISKQIKQDYKYNKEKWNKMLNEAIAYKYKLITREDGTIDYLKLSQMVQDGTW